VAYDPCVSTQARNALCVALDGSERRRIHSIAEAVSSEAGWLKIGLEAFTACGPAIVQELAETGLKIFLDLKLHDIPNTVRRAAANCAASGADMINVHASGGVEMLRAALDGARDGARDHLPTVVAVTVLTSLDLLALQQIGFRSDAEALVLRWARMAQECGLHGVVASAQEARAIRTTFGNELLIVTPGVRPQWTSLEDQRRVVTPRQAIANGADVIVVGRPITSAPSPRDAARRILAEMGSGHEPSP
jgi:orotidine-5'-phosphate decarboxylase